MRSFRSVAALALACATVAACQSPAGGGPAILPQPVSRYVCADGVTLDVRLTGDAAMISVNGSDEIQLRQLSASGNKSVYTNGTQTVEIAGGNLSYGLGRTVPVQCKDG